jgi:hypothetical protein
MQAAGADAIELNHLRASERRIGDYGVEEQDYCELVKQLKSSVKVPVAVKLSQFSHSPFRPTSVRGRRGRLVLFNRF